MEKRIERIVVEVHVCEHQGLVGLELQRPGGRMDRPE